MRRSVAVARKLAVLGAVVLATNPSLRAQEESRRPDESPAQLRECWRGTLDGTAVARYLAVGCDVLTRDAEGRTPLHLASRRVFAPSSQPDPAAVRLLLGAGAAALARLCSPEFS